MTIEIRYRTIEAAAVPMAVHHGRWDACRKTAGSIVIDEYAATDGHGRESRSEAGIGSKYRRTIDTSDNSVRYSKRVR